MGALKTLGTLDVAIKDTDAGFTTGMSSNNSDNQIDTVALNALSAAIKNMDIEPTISRVNNNINAEIDADVIMARTISKMDAELTISEFRRAM